LIREWSTISVVLIIVEGNESGVLSSSNRALTQDWHVSFLALLEGHDM
jgi:hypothetical protein